MFVQFVCLLPNFWTRYFENEWTDFDGKLFQVDREARVWKSKSTLGSRGQRSILLEAEIGHKNDESLLARMWGILYLRWRVCPVRCRVSARRDPAEFDPWARYHKNYTTNFNETWQAHDGKWPLRHNNQDEEGQRSRSLEAEVIFADIYGGRGGGIDLDLRLSSFSSSNSFKMRRKYLLQDVACSKLTLWSAETTVVPHRIIWSWYTGRWWVSSEWRLSLTFGTARRGLGGASARPGSPYCTKCNSPPINGQCTNHCIAVWL